MALNAKVQTGPRLPLHNLINAIKVLPSALRHWSFTKKALNKNYLVSQFSEPIKTLRVDVIDSLFEEKVQDDPYAYTRILIKYIAKDEKFLSPFSSDWLMVFHFCHILFSISRTSLAHLRMASDRIRKMCHNFISHF